MSIDAVACGRQKKWKSMIILLFLAVLSLVSALGTMKKEQVLSSLPVGDGAVVWSHTSAGRDALTAVTDSGSYLFSKGILTNLEDSSGGIGQSLPGDTMVGGFCLALYQSLGRELYLPESNETISFSGSILSVSVGRKSYLSAILSASGYRTRTVILSETGDILGEITLRDKTMVEAAFIKDDTILAALCLSDGGVWEIQFFTPEGELVQFVSLPDMVCYELLPLSDYAAVRTDHGIRIISEEGESASLIPGVADLWAVSDYYIACVSGETLRTYLPDGSLFGEVSLRYHPNSITVSGNRIYIHYGEGLGCYRPDGQELWFRKDGSLALMCLADRSGCILIPFHETS